MLTIILICVAFLILLPVSFILAPTVVSFVGDRLIKTISVTREERETLPESRTDMFQSYFELLVKCHNVSVMFNSISGDKVSARFTDAATAFHEKIRQLRNSYGFLVPKAIRENRELFKGVTRVGDPAYSPIGNNVWHTTKLHGVRVWFKIFYQEYDVNSPQLLVIKIPFVSKNTVEKLHKLTWDYGIKTHPLDHTENENADKTPPDVMYERVTCGSSGDIHVARSYIMGRFKESLTLEGDELKNLFDYLEKFSSKQPQYEKLGVPFKTVILLSGLPGTGKSTLPRVIATEYGVSIVELAVSGVTPKDFEAMVAKTKGKKGIVLIEDIDATGATTGRRGEKESASTAVTLSQLLNFLDGNNSPQGIIIITTNHPETFDPALVRPGRIDYEVKMSGISLPRAWDLFKHFISITDMNADDFSTEFYKEFPDNGSLIIPAAVQNLAQRVVFGFVPTNSITTTTHNEDEDEDWDADPDDKTITTPF